MRMPIRGIRQQAQYFGELSNPKFSKYVEQNVSKIFSVGALGSKPSANVMFVDAEWAIKRGYCHECMGYEIESAIIVAENLNRILRLRLSNANPYRR